jgi:glycosyltransferase involved in cell wall biosynthesis
MPTSVSVILCTHNPRPQYLTRVLASLRGQTLPTARWEFLLIDNASGQPLAETWDISWNPNGRHIREDELGLTPARLRGIQESSGELLIFVDDDNLLAPNFLDRALAISVLHPILGVFGAGVLEPEFEVQPPPELRSRLNLLALRNEPSALWSNNPRDANCKPWGAGLCVTRWVANLYRQLVADLGVTGVLDRRGQRLYSGGDDLFSQAATGVEMGFGIFPELRIIHLISASRLSQQYFLRLIHDHALSNGVLDYMFGGFQPGRIDLVRYAHVLLHGMKNGPFSMRCQWAESRGKAGAAQLISANRLKPLVSGKSVDGGRPRKVIPFGPSTGSGFSDFTGQRYPFSRKEGGSKENT